MTTAPATDHAAPEPGAAWFTRVESFINYGSPLRQWFITIAVSVVCLGAVHTLDRPHLQAWGYALVAANVVLLAVRLLPERLRGRALEVLLAVVAAVLGGAVLAVDRTGTTSMFAFFLAGNIGFRQPYVRALVLATVVSVCSTAGILVGHGLGWVDLPWYLGALTGTTVLLGSANRNRGLALDGMRAAAESAMQAAQAEARAHTLAERARIARDVHDVLAHSLAGINMQLEVVDALLENGDPDAAREAALRAQRQVREGMAEVSRTVHTLREDALPLVDTLESLVEAVAPAGTTVTVVGARREVPTPQATALARVAQESLTNARKHAPDATVRVTLTFAPSTTALDVVNGPSAGGHELAGTGSGMGLIGMRERVEIVGGTVRTGPIVDGDEAGGWRVHVEVPA